MFTSTVFSETNRHVEAVMRLDGSILVSTWSGSDNGNVGTNTVFQLCQAGSEVNVICGAYLNDCQYDSSDFFGSNTFSGVLLYTI